MQWLTLVSRNKAMTDTCCVIVCCLVACSSLVVSVLVIEVKLERRWRQRLWLMHVWICSAVRFQLPPGFLESLGVFFNLCVHPQTAEPDKPHHFAVTNLGLTSGLGWSGLDDCNPPFCNPLKKSSSQPQAYVRLPQPCNNNMVELVIMLTISLYGNIVLTGVVISHIKLKHQQS